MNEVKSILDLIPAPAFLSPPPPVPETAIAETQSADVVVVALGETGRSSGECRSRRDICLSPAQEALVDALATTGKPLVGLVLAGRPLAFPKTAEKLDALLWLWHLAQMP